MPKPNQDIHSDLNELALDLEQAADEVLRITKDCRDVDATAALMLIAKLYKHADRAASLADAVKA
ncbi:MULTISPECIES: hypothetical protein [unclassified Pseudomonas]|uniref:hypothetical protein n=1 Tax=unclassified Pseudomonas TaxID=196821 RepID=UPI001CE0431A|nr:hypothetical protein [Pseudomonas sp. Y24-6]MCA4965881.1 hypothetical protein [Pseudomonas sp. Y24-6]